MGSDIELIVGLCVQSNHVRFLRRKVQDTDLGNIVRGLRAVTPHVDLLQGVWDLLLFQLQPHFLAVGTPEKKRESSKHRHHLLTLMGSADSKGKAALLVGDKV